MTQKLRRKKAVPFPLAIIEDNSNRAVEGNRASDYIPYNAPLPGTQDGQITNETSAIPRLWAAPQDGYSNNILKESQKMGNDKVGNATSDLSTVKSKRSPKKHAKTGTNTSLAIKGEGNAVKLRTKPILIDKSNSNSKTLNSATSNRRVATVNREERNQNYGTIPFLTLDVIAPQSVLSKGTVILGNPNLRFADVFNFSVNNITIRETGFYHFDICFNVGSDSPNAWQVFKTGVGIPHAVFGSERTGPVTWNKPLLVIAGEQFQIRNISLESADIAPVPNQLVANGGNFTITRLANA